LSPSSGNKRLKPDALETITVIRKKVKGFLRDEEGIKRGKHDLHNSGIHPGFQCAQGKSIC